MVFKAGLVGYGFAGQTFHAPLMAAADMEITAITSSNAQAVSNDWPDAINYTTPQEMFANNDLDLVVLATPNQTHYPLAVEALKAGRNVVVDKPIAATEDEVNHLIELAQSKDLIVSSFQNRRWDGDFLTIQDLIEKDYFGKIHNFAANFEFYRPSSTERRLWKEQPDPIVGVHYDLGAHLLDQVHVLFGMPNWVEGEVFIQRAGGKVPDTCFMRLGYDNGLRCNLTASYFSPDFKSKFLIQGEKAGFRKYHMDIQEPQLKAKIKPDHPEFGIEPSDRHGILTTYKNSEPIERAYPTIKGCQRQYYVQTRKAIENKAPAPVPPEQSRDVIAVIQALLKASNSHKRILL